MKYDAWVAKAARQHMVLESVDVGPLGAEDLEVAVDSGISQYPAVLGHEVVGRITAVGPNAKGLKVGQRAGIGWMSGSRMHCRQCMSGRHHLCPQAQLTTFGTVSRRKTSTS